MKLRSYLNLVLSILVFGGVLLGPAAAIASPEIDPSNNPNWKFCEALIVPGNPTIYAQHVSCGRPETSSSTWPWRWKASLAPA